MEEDLDKVAEGKKIWYKILESFYKEFEPEVENAFDKMEKKKMKKPEKYALNVVSLWL